MRRCESPDIQDTPNVSLISVTECVTNHSPPPPLTPPLPGPVPPRYAVVRPSMCISAKCFGGAQRMRCVCVRVVQCGAGGCIKFDPCERRFASSITIVRIGILWSSYCAYHQCRGCGRGVRSLSLARVASVPRTRDASPIQPCIHMHASTRIHTNTTQVRPNKHKHKDIHTYAHTHIHTRLAVTCIDMP